MIFDEQIIDNKIIPERDYRLLTRRAARAIIINPQNRTILLMNVNNRSYKLPGGGIEDNETYMKGLMRELKEETGYSNCIVKQNVGRIVQRNVDRHDSMVIFEMESKFYECEVFGKPTITSLTEEEKEDNMYPEWVKIENAIRKNEECMRENSKTMYLIRENMSLRHIENAYFSN